ncbi:ribosome biogenesis GTPase Der [Litoribrevibacter albus]|uniref:GTPase Der n=1 Tax=Litoribrevibacter albus TaxID=1473156 RepID=A0AA37SAF4_9GAMM|nr:ribosome biogenesis GTPase Der [Litoribrevibacter albus]GLQ32055.1 GTPase Der [Litoribrevibacter albus]
MDPVIALVGRPNVGKSTLFNRLTKSRDALVADFAGLTRDRKYGQGRLGDRRYMVIDTGGIAGDEEGIDQEMAKQSLLAIEEADIVLFLVDGKAGLTVGDEEMVKYLRSSDKQAWLVVNKTDGIDPETAMADFYGLGLTAEPFPIAASQNRGIKSLMDEVFDYWDSYCRGLVAKGELESYEPGVSVKPDSRGIKIGVVGRPNVGKSTLVNRLLGEERVVVYDMPGTTRDSVYIPYERYGKEYTLIDTAGVRRRKNVKETVEKFSIIKTMQAIEDANVVVLVIDAQEGLVEQDLHLLGYVLEAGRAFTIAINKWDGLSEDKKAHIKKEIERRLVFTNYADIHFISALHGSNVGNLYGSIEIAYEAAMGKWTTNYLTQILEDAVKVHTPPVVRGHRIKLRYAHQGGSNPPRIVIHGNQTTALPNSYQRYLENTFRRVLNIVGTPMAFEFRTGDNPFANKRDTRTPNQKRKDPNRVKPVKKKSVKRK